MPVAALQFIVGQTACLAPEQHRHRARPCLPDDFRGRFPNVAHGPGYAPLAGTGSNHPHAVADGRFQVIEHPAAFNDIAGARRPPLGLGIREALRPHQRQAPDAHGFHGPRGGADVARMAWLHQHDADVLKTHVR